MEMTPPAVVVSVIRAAATGLPASGTKVIQRVLPAGQEGTVADRHFLRNSTTAGSRGGRHLTMLPCGARRRDGGGAEGGGIWQAPGRASPGWRRVPAGAVRQRAPAGTCRRTTPRMARARDYLPHDHARSRACRWGEDCLAGICDIEQRLCPGLALRNGRDPILQERVRPDRRPGQSWRARQGPLVEGPVGHARSRHTRGGSLAPHPQNAPDRRFGLPCRRVEGCGGRGADHPALFALVRPAS